MAKRKGKGLDTGFIVITKDLKIASRVKVGAVLWLQEKYDMDISEIMPIIGSGKTAHVVNLLVALAIQHDCNKTETDIMKMVNDLELGELSGAFKDMKKAFETDVKNSKGQEVPLQE